MNLQQQLKESSSPKSFYHLSVYSMIVIFIGLVLITSLLLIIQYQISTDYDRTIEEASRETMNLTMAFEEHVERMIADADRDLLSLKQAYEQDGISSTVIASYMENKMKNPSRYQIAVINKEGIIAKSSVKEVIGVNLADRKYFISHRDSVNQALDIGRTVIGRTSHTSIIPLSRRIENPDGSFAGIVYIGLNSDYFLSFYKKIDLGEEQVISLVGTDRIIRARQSGDTAKFDQDTYDNTIWENIQTGNTNDTYIRTNGIDGINRIFGYRVMADYPLVLLVGKSIQVTLAPFEKRKQAYILGASLFSLLIVIICTLLINRAGKQRVLHKKLEALVGERTRELVAITMKLEEEIKERQASQEELSKLNDELTSINIALKEEMMERQLAEQSLQETQAILQAALDNCQAGIVVVDAPDGKVRYLNKAGQAITNYPEAVCSEGVNNYLMNWQVFHDNGACFKHPLLRAIHYGETCSDECIILREHDKDLVIWANAAPIKDEAGKIKAGIMIFLDISERKRMEEFLVKAKEEAERATVAKSKFLANMSHEIRTPMNGIIGMTDLTLMTALEEEQREYLNTVKSSARALLRVLNDILDYSKIEAGKIELEETIFDIWEITNEVVDLFTIAAKQKGVGIQLHIAKEIPHAVIGDSVRLRQVLSNLVGNGIKFTFQGEIVIDVELEEKTADKVKLRFMVSDTGIGIANEKLNKLFKRFSQIDDSHTKQFGGTGLGLAISQKLIELMSGEIGVESKVGVGSRFFFSAVFKNLNKIENDYEDTVHPEVIKNVKPECKTILLAEDDVVSRDMIKIILEKNGLRVIAVENGEEAIAALKKQRFDMILMDINMPYLDGYSATNIIRMQEKNKKFRIPILAMTAYALKGDREKCLAAGMDDYISKPIDLKSMIELINKWLIK